MESMPALRREWSHYEAPFVLDRQSLQSLRGAEASTPMTTKPTDPNDDPCQWRSDDATRIKQTAAEGVCEHGTKNAALDCMDDCHRCGHACHHGEECAYEHWGSDNMDVDVCGVDECRKMK